MPAGTGHSGERDRSVCPHGTDVLMRRLTIKIVICQVVSEMLYAGKPIIQSESRVRRDSLDGGQVHPHRGDI